jgi:hypothetical protein
MPLDVTTLLPRDVTPAVAALQVQRYRAMSFEDKLRLADGMWRLAWELTCAGVRHRQPDLDASAVHAAARAILRAAAD